MLSLKFLSHNKCIIIFFFTKSRYKMRQAHLQGQKTNLLLNIDYQTSNNWRLVSKNSRKNRYHIRIQTHKGWQVTHHFRLPSLELPDFQQSKNLHPNTWSSGTHTSNTQPHSDGRHLSGHIFFAASPTDKTINTLFKCFLLPQ